MTQTPGKHQVNAGARLTPRRGFAVRPGQGSRAGVTITEMLVVMMLVGILTVASTTIYVNARKQDDLAGEARKIQKAMATARSYAISSEDHYFQITFWNDRPWRPRGYGYWYWIDEIAACDLSDAVTPTTVTRAKIVTPESLNIQLAFPHDLVSDPHPRITGGVADPSLNTIAFRFCPDGTSDDGAIALIRREANPEDSSAYQRVRLYGPTARSRVFDGLEPPP